MKPVLVKIKDLKKGDKFYYYDELVYILLELIVIHGDSDNITLRVKRFKTKVKLDIDIHGQDVINNEVYLFNGWDSGSFFAGFRAAFNICTPHMGVFDLENAEVGEHLKNHLAGLKAHKEWQNNNFSEKM